MTWDAAFEANYSDGVIVLHHGRVVYERHDGCLDAKTLYPLLPNWRYGSMWWISNDEHGAYAARGVHGQTTWIDPKADMLIVRFASHPVAANAANDPTSLPAYRAVAEHLMATDKTPLRGPEWVIEDIAGTHIVARRWSALTYRKDNALSSATVTSSL